MAGDSWAYDPPLPPLPPRHSPSKVCVQLGQTLPPLPPRAFTVTVIHRQKYRHDGCANRAIARLALCTLNKLGGSRENLLELVKTLIVIFPIVNFPAEGSQTSMIPHIFLCQKTNYTPMPKRFGSKLGT